MLLPITVHPENPVVELTVSDLQTLLHLPPSILEIANLIAAVITVERAHPFAKTGAVRTLVCVTEIVDLHREQSYKAAVKHPSTCFSVGSETKIDVLPSLLLTAARRHRQDRMI